MTNGVLSSYSYAFTAAQTSSGKIALPVPPAYLIYAHLEHVSGYAAPQSQGSVSLNKLHLLNSLIDQVSSTQNNPDAVRMNVENLPESRIDSLIDKYQSKVMAAMQNAQKNPYALIPQGVEGVMVNVNC